MCVLACWHEVGQPCLMGRLVVLPLLSCFPHPPILLLSSSSTPPLTHTLTRPPRTHKRTVAPQDRGSSFCICFFFSTLTPSHSQAWQTQYLSLLLSLSLFYLSFFLCRCGKSCFASEWWCVFSVSVKEADITLTLPQSHRNQEGGRSSQTGQQTG